MASPSRGVSVRRAWRSRKMEIEANNKKHLTNAARLRLLRLWTMFDLKNEFGELSFNYNNFIFFLVYKSIIRHGHNKRVSEFNLFYIFLSVVFAFAVCVLCVCWTVLKLQGFIHRNADSVFSMLKLNKSNQCKAVDVNVFFFIWFRLEIYALSLANDNKTCK